MSKSSLDGSSITLLPATRPKSKLNTDVIVSVLVAAHQESYAIGQTMRLIYEDAAKHGYPVVVCLNAPVGANERAVRKTIREVQKAHRAYSSNTTFIVDMGRYDDGSPGMWRRDMMSSTINIANKYLNVPADGGKTVVVMSDADVVDYLPKGKYFASFAQAASETNYQQVLYPLYFLPPGLDLPPRLKTLVEIQVRLLMEVHPFPHDGSQGLPLSLYLKTRGYQPEWQVSEGQHFMKANSLTRTVVPGALSIGSARRHEFSLNQRVWDFTMFGWKAEAIHRTKTSFRELNEKEFSTMLYEIVNNHVGRSSRYFAIDGGYDRFFGPVNNEVREFQRDRGAAHTEKILSDAGLPELGAELKEKMMSQSVDVPFVPGEYTKRVGDVPLGSMSQASQGQSVAVTLPSLSSAGSE